MAGAPTPEPAMEGGAARAAFRAFAEALASDLDLIADLHDREPSAAVIEAVQSGPVAEQLALVLSSAEGRTAAEALDAAGRALPRPVDAATLDTLAAGYAEVYLRHTFRAAPTESPWMTEDGLERQAPMFEIRETMKRHGLTSTDWAGRTEDHMVVQLRFVARLVRAAGDAGDPARLAAPTEFLDAHLMRWVRPFAVRLVRGGAPDWFVALALLTATYLDEARAHLASLTGIARPPERPLVPVRSSGGADESPAAYVPGVAPSW